MGTESPQGSEQLVKAPVRLGLAPRNIEEGFRLANLLAQSELVPKNFRNKPADVLVAIELGMELGLAPMQSLQSIAVINGRPSVWGDGFLGLIMACGPYLDHDEYYEVDGKRRDGLTPEDLKKDTTCAVCTFLRRDKASPVTRRFSVGAAKKAGLFGKEGPWQQYPDRMLMMRARSWAGRDCFPDVLRGLVVAEEAQDIPADPHPAPVIREVRRMSETVVDASSPSTSLEASAESAAPVTKETARVEGKVAGVKTFDAKGEEWYAIVTLDSGKALETTNQAAAAELQKFAGTDHVVAFELDGMNIVEFGLAD